MATIFAANSLDGGRYSVRLKFITDTATDGGTTYTTTSTDVFYDTNPNTPSVNKQLSSEFILSIFKFSEFIFGISSL
mgnify:CR=1 FL=1